MTEHEHGEQYRGLLEEKHEHHAKPSHSGGGIPLPLLLLIVGIVCLVVGYAGAMFLRPPATAQPAATPTPTVDLQQLRTTTTKMLNDLLALQGAEGVSVESTSALKNGTMYLLSFDLKENGTIVQKANVYISPDGKYMFLSQPIDLTVPLPTPTAAPVVEMQKSDKPVVEMFVMSFCPYGIQAENGLGPVTGLLNGTITFQPHFIVGGINTSLHGPVEAWEDARQLCVLKYARDKWWKYVDYVNNNCNLDDIETCWKTAANNASVDVARIEKCFKEEGETLINAEAGLSESLGISSSPTILINGVEYQGSRSPEAFKQTICTAYNVVPAVCSQNLTSSASASTGSC